MEAIILAAIFAAVTAAIAEDAIRILLESEERDG